MSVAVIKYPDPKQPKRRKDAYYPTLPGPVHHSRETKVAGAQGSSSHCIHRQEKRQMNGDTPAAGHTSPIPIQSRIQTQGMALSTVH